VTTVLFQLGGHEFFILREEVEQRVTGLQPVRNFTKGFYVEIDGKFFAARQVVAAAMDQPPDKLTTLDACKVLTLLGFEVTYKRKN
jgi:hypothetical protein